MTRSAYTRNSYKGNVSYTDTLASGINNSQTTITLASGTTFPTGSGGPYVVTVDPGSATEEKVLVTSRSGATLTVDSAGRGYDGTTASAHSSGVTVLHTISAVDLDEANQAVSQLLGQATTAGQRPYVTGSGTYSMLAAGTAGQTTAMNDAGTAPINVNTPPLSDHKPSVRAATTGALATGTYSGGVFTVTANGALAAQDGVTLVVGDRLLVKNQATGSQNGIYTVTTVGTVSTQAVLTRATDFDTSAKVTPDAWCMVEEGTTLAGSSWRVTNTGTITLDTTALTFGLVPAVAVSKAGTLVGRRGAVNLIEGTNVTMTVADNSGSDRVDITINSSGGGGVPANGTATVATLESTGSTSFTDLTTPGPAVTVTTGTKAFVTVTAHMQHDTINAFARMSFAISGASSVAAAQATCLELRAGSVANEVQDQMSATYLITGLTAGSNTFTAKYFSSTAAGLAYFQYRNIAVIDMGS